MKRATPNSYKDLDWFRCWSFGRDDLSVVPLVVLPLVLEAGPGPIVRPGEVDVPVAVDDEPAPTIAQSWNREWKVASVTCAQDGHD